MTGFLRPTDDDFLPTWAADKTDNEPTKNTNEYENIKESSREQELLTNSNKPVGKTKFQLFLKPID